jgi:hypothetical protein
MNEELNMTNLSTSFGDIRISEEGAYYDGKFTIELLSYWNDSVESWGMPAWEDMGYPNLHHHFDTVNDAFIALKADYLID